MSTAALAAAFSLAAVAGASAHTPSPLSAAFTVLGTNGFSIDVESEGGRVAVVASERHPPVATFSQGGWLRPADPANGASTIYYAHGPIRDPTRVEARLGRLGRIAVSFQPSGLVRVTKQKQSQGAGGCGFGRRLVRRLGTFVGTVEFHGENGYTSVQATRARGSIGTPLPRDCRSEAAGRAREAVTESRPWPAPGSAVLNAVDRQAGVRFEAAITDAGAAFLAILKERQRGGLTVSRRAYASAPPSAFTFNSALSLARVKPPAPFSGAAHYASGRKPGSGRWKGDLTATFAGATVAMAGSGFTATLGASR